MTRASQNPNQVNGDNLNNERSESSGNLRNKLGASGEQN
jgi:hypothetical protein